MLETLLGEDQEQEPPGPRRCACGAGAQCEGPRPKQLVTLLSALVDNIRQGRLKGAMSAGDPPRTLRDPGAPSDLPLKSDNVEEDVLKKSTFEEFSKNLEGFHDQIHVWVGGSMSVVPTAGYDPIFYAHHAMVDRLWSIWQSSPHGQNPSMRLFNEVLTPFPMTVAQVLSIEDLGYEYAVEALD